MPTNRKPPSVLNPAALAAVLGVTESAAVAIMARDDFPATRVDDTPAGFVVESNLLTQWIRQNARRCPGINDGPFD